MMQQSRQALDSIDYHKSVIEGCEKMLVILNPEFAREKERESEIANMRNEMSDLKEANARLVAMMEQLVGSVNGNNNQEICSRIRDKEILYISFIRGIRRFVRLEA